MDGKQDAKETLFSPRLRNYRVVMSRNGKKLTTTLFSSNKDNQQVIFNSFLLISSVIKIKNNIRN